VILDESTSAVDVAAEDTIYRRCVDAGMTLVSVGHRTTLRKFHHMV
jgi:ABC-type uncharacterized transport system fused permease/ATPase subunit